MKRFLVALAVLLAPTGAPAQEAPGAYGFSAEVFFGAGDAEPRRFGRIFASRAGFRIARTTGGEGFDIVIVDFAADRMYRIDSAEKTYSEHPANRFVRMVLPCDGYRTGVKLDAETLDGRAVEKWHCEGSFDPAGNPRDDGTFWHDPALRSWTRILFDNGELVELRDIDPGPQDAALFDIPSGYERRQ